MHNDKREFNTQSPSYQAMARATETIFADIRLGGPWSRRIVAAKTPAESRIAQTSFDGPTRKPTFSERLRRLEPLPPCVVIDWADDQTLYVFAIGLPESAPDFAEQVVVTERDISEAADRLISLVSDAFEFLDSIETEAIKVYKMPNEVKQLMPWLEDAQKR
jgi:hypothetical protein